jgi:hypothetical protein
MKKVEKVILAILILPAFCFWNLIRILSVLFTDADDLGWPWEWDWKWWD